MAISTGEGRGKTQNFPEVRQKNMRRRKKNRLSEEMREMTFMAESILFLSLHNNGKDTKGLLSAEERLAAL